MIYGPNLENLMLHRRWPVLLLVTLFTASLSAAPQSDPPPASPPGHAHEVKPPTPAEHAAPAEQPRKSGDDHLSVTEHEMTIDGKTLKYQATAGTLALKDESGKTKANMFFVAYEKQPAAQSASLRPITFVFNGGPGAAAVWLHLGAMGPQRVKLNENGEPPTPPGGLIDNPYTWLNATDLVFIDPVGTGYSRPAPGEKQGEFSGVQEDVQSVGEFIRLYITRYNRWLSPKFLAGESYGTTRAAALSDHLLGQGIALNGIVFISTIFNFQTLSPSQGNELPYMLYVPSYTSIAWYYKKLPADLQANLSNALNESEHWALHDYLPALAKGASLTAAERADVVKKLVRYTGLEERIIDKADLRIDPTVFRGSLLGDQHKVIGRFDARMSGYNADPLSNRADFDPSLSPYLTEYSAAFNEYVRQSLKFESDLEYDALTGRVQPWNFGHGGNGYLDVSGALQNAMRQNPHMHVLFASGLFDLATPYFATNYTINHLDLSPELRGNIAQTFYHSGHMIYHHYSSLKQLHEDATQFIEKAVPATQPAK